MNYVFIYGVACRAITECVNIDVAYEISDMAWAMAVYARQAENSELEAQATEILIRARRKIVELRAELETTQCPDKALIDSS